MGAENPEGCLEVSIIWDGKELCLNIRNRRSETLWRCVMGLRQHLEWSDRGTQPVWVWTNSTFCISALQQVKVLMPWEGQPISFAIGYESEPELPWSRHFDLPADFLRDWPDFGPRRKIWKFPRWDPAASIAKEVASGGLNLDVIQKNRHSIILVLGKDTGKGLHTLTKICAIIRDTGYYPVLLKDIPEHEFASSTIEEKLNTISNICEFVIVEDSVASGHLLELSLLARNRRIAAVLRQKGQGSTWMTSDYEIDFSHIKTFVYERPKLEHAVVRGIDWAEQTIEERAGRLRSKYPWRRGS